KRQSALQFGAKLRLTGRLTNYKRSRRTNIDDIVAFQLLREDAGPQRPVPANVNTSEEYNERQRLLPSTETGGPQLSSMPALECVDNDDCQIVFLFSDRHRTEQSRKRFRFRMSMGAGEFAESGGPERFAVCHCRLNDAIRVGQQPVARLKRHAD